MFANAFQSGFISIFYSVGSNPLALWDKQVKNGHIRRIIDEEVKSLVLDISGSNVITTYITCPIKHRASLGIKLPFLVMVIKNMKKYFTFEIQIRDDRDLHRRFRVSNFQSTTKVRQFYTSMPIGLSDGWNQVQFNLADFTKRAYGTTYVETVRVQIHANVRIRRIYFSDMLYNDEDLPTEFKLFKPLPQPRKPLVRLDTKKTKAEKKVAQPPPTPTGDQSPTGDVPEEEKSPEPASSPEAGGDEEPTGATEGADVAEATEPPLGEEPPADGEAAPAGTESTTEEGTGEAAAAASAPPEEGTPDAAPAEGDAAPPSETADAPAAAEPAEETPAAPAAEEQAAAE